MVTYSIPLNNCISLLKLIKLITNFIEDSKTVRQGLRSIKINYLVDLKLSTHHIMVLFGI